MLKDDVIAELLALPPAEQRQILMLLWERLGEGAAGSEGGEQDTRAQRSARQGSRGDPWGKVYQELSKTFRRTAAR
ncbi:MAG TPA: hypothetical protein VM008_11025 [Phycisphaerae bacterium]|nr:hypothetical protein [Phycisphaerae bacterium]